MTHTQHIHTHARTHARTHAHMHAYTKIHMHTHPPPTHIRHTHTHTHARTRTHTHTHTHTTQLLEYMDLGSLAGAIDQGRLQQERQHGAPPCMPTVLSCAADVARGLAYLHSNGVVHGDLTVRACVCVCVCACARVCACVRVQGMCV